MMSHSRLHPVVRARYSHSRGAFTLVELLVVLAIIAILGALAVPALQGTLGGINLKGGGDTVVGLFNLARQTASSRNLSLDVRLYQDPNSNNNYRILALVIPASVSGASQDEFITKPMALPGDVIIDSNTTYSSLLTASATQMELTSAPLMVQGHSYVKFTFLPNNALNLDSTKQWCLTLMNLHNKAGTGTTPAANYIAIVMDPQSGRSSVFRP